MQPEEDTRATAENAKEPVGRTEKRDKPKRRNNIFLRGLSFLLFLCLIGAGLVCWDAYRFLHTPASTEPVDVVIAIEPGATFDRVAYDLLKAGAVTDVYRFRLLGKWTNSLGAVRAGEFLVNTGWTPEQVLRQITKGQALLYKMVVREGLTWWETAKVIEEQGFARFEDLKKILHDPVFLRKHQIPFSNAEGFLFPETYLLRKPKSLDEAQALEIADLMVRMFWKKTEPLWQQLPMLQEGETSDRAADQIRAAETVVAGLAENAVVDIVEKVQGPSGNGTISGPELASPRPDPRNIDPDVLRKLIILASLVERETGVPEERARVAGVFANRLFRGMRLECDPTIIYGIGEKFSGSIRRSQIDDADNLYNTYQHAGLPPGPICSPGYAAIAAALYPEKHDYLFFVATGKDKGHVFSETYREHERAVQRYRAVMRQQ